MTSRKRMKKDSDLTYVIGIIAVIVIIIAIVAIKGCQPQPAETEEEEDVITPVVEDEPTVEVEAEQVQEEESDVSMKDEVENLAVESTGFCGDGICQNIESEYPDAKLACDNIQCYINGKRTENNFICPGDCGFKCDETISLGYEGCDLTADGDAVLTIKSSGRGEIPGGILFYINADSGDTGFDVSTEPLESGESKEYTVELSKWADEYGSIKKIVAVPRTIVDGQTKACVNQRIGYTVRNCKGYIG